MFQTPVTQQIIGLVDDGLDPKRAAVLEVLLDPGVLEEALMVSPTTSRVNRPAFGRRFVLPAVAEEVIMVSP